MDSPVVTAVLAIVGMVAAFGLVYLPFGWLLRSRVGGVALVLTAVAVSVFLTLLATANIQALRAAHEAPSPDIREVAFFASMFALMAVGGAAALEFQFRRDPDPDHPLTLRNLAWGLLGLVAGLLSSGVLFVSFGFDWLFRLG